MRAARLVQVGRMECEEIDIPNIQNNHVIVKTEMASICGSDLHFVKMGAGIAHALPCPHGYPGHEGIGEVVESQNEKLKIGTKVLTAPHVPDGECFNEYQKIQTKYCIPLDKANIPRSHQMMAQQLATVMYAMKLHPFPISGKTVLILGQGSAGLFWTYLLKRAGAEKIIVSDLSDSRLTVSKLYGADICINATKENVESIIMDYTNGLGVEYVVEAVGRSDTLLQSVELAKLDGEIMWFGLPSVSQNIDFNFYKFFRKRLKASTVYGVQEEPSQICLRKALMMISQNEINVEPLLSHYFNIEYINNAMDLAYNPIDQGALKVSIKFD